MTGGVRVEACFMTGRLSGRFFGKDVNLLWQSEMVLRQERKSAKWKKVLRCRPG